MIAHFSDVVFSSIFIMRAVIWYRAITIHADPWGAETYTPTFALAKYVKTHVLHRVIYTWRYYHPGIVQGWFQKNVV